MTSSFVRRLTAEGVGTFFLLACVVGSGIMGDSLASGNVAVALLANSLATGAVLAVLIVILGPVSGAHFNPAVTLAMTIRRKLPRREALPYIIVQVLTGIAGVLAANAMFGPDVVQVSGTARTGMGQWLGEVIATMGLLLTIFGCIAKVPHWVGPAVGLYITAAYWFTSSTSFANPAVTIARMFSDTFAGIAPADAPFFIAMQLAGMAIALWLSRLLWPDEED